VSPGARSTPLVLAFLASEARLHVVLDERVAAFVALGLAKVSRRPVALVCTSGSAGAHYLPAFVEARASGVPLVALTANRPPELWEAGASQTVPQQGLLQPNARWARSLGPPDGRDTRWVARVAAQALAACQGPPTGPVHLDVAFRKPLWAPGLALPSGTACVPRIVQAPPRVDAAQVFSEHADLERVTVVCGPDAPGAGDPRAFARALGTLASARGWPVLADPAAGLRWGDHDRDSILGAADAFLRDVDVATHLSPSHVLRFGRLPTSKAIQAWLQGRPTTLVDPQGEWHDPSNSAHRLVVADPTECCRSLTLDSGARQRAQPATPSTWLRAWQRVESAAQTHLSQSCRGLWSGAVARVVVEHLAPDALLLVGSSTPIRDLDAFAPPAPKPLRVLCNRGANGIDGTLSTAWGAALAWPGPLTLLTGDLTFLHDAGGLLAARGLGVNAHVVVVDNGGGGIFHYLPIAEHPAFERCFLTPQATSLSHLCAAAGVTHREVNNLSTLARGLAAPPPRRRGVGRGGRAPRVRRAALQRVGRVQPSCPPSPPRRARGGDDVSFPVPETELQAVRVTGSSSARGVLQQTSPSPWQATCEANRGTPNCTADALGGAARRPCNRHAAAQGEGVQVLGAKSRSACAKRTLRGER
jgi:2-succinyl-5-enolpyruvyl-6-hydroxy-3-cyclohexene-1-carboxylate synthase